MHSFVQMQLGQEKTDLPTRDTEIMQLYPFDKGKMSFQLQK